MKKTLGEQIIFTIGLGTIAYLALKGCLIHIAYFLEYLNKI